VIWCQSPEIDKSEPSFTTTGAIIVVATKSDLRLPVPPGHLPVSALTGEGLDALGVAVAGAFFRGHCNHSSTASEPLLTRARHREAVTAGLAQVRLAEQEIAGGEPVLVAAALRAAAESLHALIGASDNEAILDRLFADFCVGK
jgi:tRNA modification GTPase